MSNLQIARTIQQQIFAGGKMKVMSWGAHNWMGSENFLRFKVNGHHHKGYVKVTLNSMDTYDIEYINRRGRVVDSVEGVYCDQLTEVIDRRVEYISGYSR